jgi:hypothetical protein
MAVNPSLNVTEPVGTPAPGEAALTVAVNMRAWPKTLGLAEETTAVVVEACVTFWLRLADVDPLKFPSPV